MTGVAAEVGSTANNYQILARLASGGMAEIFLARGTSNTGVERYCVLKRILRERANDAQFVRMFLDEARLAAQLQHPHVAQVYDIGKLGDSFFFTMEYVHGETVRALLHRARSLRRDLPMNVIMTIVAGAAAGLHHAHERLGHDGRPLGIVHRDVSPSNLMVSYEGNVKVVDFGVAKAENRATETRSGTVKGKISYLSPEQCKGGAIDRRSDLFSLGIVLWEMLAMERLFKRNSDFENMTAIVNEEPTPPSTRRSGSIPRTIPPELDAISLKLLAKDPAQRFQTADELVEAVEDASAKTSTMISASALSRFLREMFGQRPEPWLELDAATHEVPIEGLTVTSEPVPAELVIAPAPSLDMQLAQVRDISALQRATEGVPTEAPQYIPSGPVTERATPAARLTLPLPAPAPSVVSHPGYPIPTSASPQSFPPLDSSSGSYPYASGSQPSYSVIDGETPRISSRGWPLISIVAAAAIIGSLTVYFAMRGGGGEKAIADAALVAGAPSDAADEPEVLTVEIDAPAIVDAHVRVSVDAANAAVDAAVVKPPVDAAPDPFMVAVKSERHADVVELCNRSIATNQAASCTVSACQLRLDDKARKWGNKVPVAARRNVIAACRNFGIDLAPRRPPPRGNDAGVAVDPCVARPQDCM